MIRTALRPLAWVVLAAVASALPAAGEVASWGVVDMVRVGAEYKAMRDLNEQFQRFQADQEEALQLRHKTRLLDDEERQEFLDLCQVAAPTEARDERLAELEKLSDTRERERFELRRKVDCTEQEEARLKQLDALYDRRMEELAALEADVRQSRIARWEELTKLLTESVNGAVKGIAEQKRLTLVVRKETVLFGGVDITEELLAKLNATPLKAD